MRRTTIKSYDEKGNLRSSFSETKTSWVEDTFDALGMNSNPDSANVRRMMTEGEALSLAEQMMELQQLQLKQAYQQRLVGD